MEANFLWCRWVQKTTREPRDVLAPFFWLVSATSALYPLYDSNPVFPPPTSSLPSPARNMSQLSQQALLAALAAQSSRPRPATIPYSALGPSQLKSEATSANSRTLHCPREGCGSLLLQPGGGVWADLQASVVCSSLRVDCPANAHVTDTCHIQLPDDPSSPFPAAAAPHAVWHVASGPFAFDNIGFSRPDAATTLPPHTPSGAGSEQRADKGKVKWLICADCDLGPLGWTYEGERDAWLAVERVGYGESK